MAAHARLIPGNFYTWEFNVNAAIRLALLGLKRRFPVQARQAIVVRTAN
jgi:hypothetical protein